MQDHVWEKNENKLFVAFIESRGYLDWVESSHIQVLVGLDNNKKTHEHGKSQAQTQINTLHTSSFRNVRTSSSSLFGRRTIALLRPTTTQQEQHHRPRSGSSSSRVTTPGIPLLCIIGTPTIPTTTTTHGGRGSGEPHAHRGRRRRRGQHQQHGHDEGLTPQKPHTTVVKGTHSLEFWWSIYLFVVRFLLDRFCYCMSCFY